MVWWEMEEYREILTRKVEGSITVYLTLVLVLLLALTGTMLDSGRYFSAGGYVKMTAHNAAMVAFGKYNLELWEEYGLYGYGGYDGINLDRWQEEFDDLLIGGMQTRPEHSWRRYASLYQIQSIRSRVRQVEWLSDPEQFRSQIHEWALTHKIQDISSKVQEGIGGDTGGGLSSIEDSLKQNDEIEKGKRKSENIGTGVDDSVRQDIKGDNAENSTRGEEQDDQPEDVAGGNPLEFVKELLAEGILSLVCDTSQLSEEHIENCESTEDKEEEFVNEAGKEEQAEDQTGSGMILSLLREGGEDHWGKSGALSSGVDKMEALYYAASMFDSYVQASEKSFDYGQEYLIAGKTSEKENLAAIVNRLLCIRTLVNYGYIKGNVLLQEKSLVTATAIASLLAAEPLVKVIQEVVLLVLALEESCIDIAGLMQGRVIPLVKNDMNFKMRYEEICMCHASFFQDKAKEYPQSKGGLQVNQLKEGMDYGQYIWLFMMTVPRDTLYQRSQDLIQMDLRKRFNQTFTIHQSICNISTDVYYALPVISGKLGVAGTSEVDQSGRVAAGLLSGKTKINYGY